MVALSVTATQVLPGTTDAQFEQGAAGATITQGQALYLDTAANTYKLADANDTAATAVCAGIAMCAASSGQPVRLQTAGTFTVGAGAAPSAGVVYCVGTTAGSLVPIADLTSTQRVSIVGVGGATNTIVMGRFNSGQTI